MTKGFDIMDGRMVVVTVGIDIVWEGVTDCCGEDVIFDGDKESVPDVREVLGSLPLGVAPWLGWREELEYCSEGDSQ